MRKLLLVLFVSALPAFAGEATATVSGQLLDRTCYDQTYPGNSIPCVKDGTVNRVVAVVEVYKFSYYFPVWCEREKGNLGACLNPAIFDFVSISGLIQPQWMSPPPGGSGQCAWAIGAVYLQPYASGAAARRPGGGAP